MRTTIPDKGIASEELLRHLEESKRDDVRWHEGRTWSLVYHLDDQHQELVKRVYGDFLSENYLNPFAFKSASDLEGEIVDMCADLFRGNKDVVGTFTSGGTESIFLALYSYRERTQRLRKVRSPEIITPASVHPAFDKAAHMLGLKVRRVAVGDSFAADAKAMAKAITNDTIMMVCSAPSYPHGVMDPVVELGEIALKNGLPLHIDACIGGFMLPWVEELGYPVVPWDFRVPGVTSISADLHKFGYAPKGASVLMYKSEEFLKHQFYIQPSWSGGIYASTTLLGSRTAGPIAAAWTALKSIGRDGYLSVTQELMTAAYELRTHIGHVDGLEVVGDPVMNIVACRSNDPAVDIYVVADKLEKAGWTVDRQQLPPSIHTTVMKRNLPVLERYKEDLAEAVEFARNNPAAASEGNAAIYGVMARVPMRGMVSSNVRRLLLDLYSSRPDKNEGEAGAEIQQTPASWMGILNRILKLFGRG